MLGRMFMVGEGEDEEAGDDIDMLLFPLALLVLLATVASCSCCSWFCWGSAEAVFVNVWMEMVVIATIEASSAITTSLADIIILSLIR